MIIHFVAEWKIQPFQDQHHQKYLLNQVLDSHPGRLLLEAQLALEVRFHCVVLNLNNVTYNDGVDIQFFVFWYS